MSTSAQPTSPKKKLKAALESREPQDRSFLDYRGFITKHYDGLPGALTHVTGWVTGHESLAGRLIRPKGFNIQGCKRILDAGCGNGRYSKYLLKQADPDAHITSFDISHKMLLRSRDRLKDARLTHVAADLTRLPYAENVFDAVVSGYVLEHLHDAEVGLREVCRVMKPGGKFLLLVTEDTLAGALCSRLWHCRTYNRNDLRRLCEACAWDWQRELWLSRMHSLFKLGGIIVELRKREEAK